MPKARNYTRERLNEKPERRRKRAIRNKARREAIRDGRARKGDGTHVDHKKPLRNGGSNAKSNTRVVSASKNSAEGGRAGKGKRKR